MYNFNLTIDQCTSLLKPKFIRKENQLPKSRNESQLTKLLISYNLSIIFIRLKYDPRSMIQY